MLSPNEILRALTASLQLARGDAGGHRLFDHTFEGFWRSFAAIILFAPAYLLSIRTDLIIDNALGRTVPEAGVEFYFLRFIVLVVEWVAYPVAMVAMARMLALGHRYVPYIIAYNWTSVLVAAAVVPPRVLFSVGLIAAGFTQLLYMVALIWAFYFRYSVARTALETSIPTAIGLVIFDFLLGLLINFIGVGLDP